MAPRNIGNIGIIGIMVLLSASFTLTACGKSLVQQVEALADETCACTDKACVEAVGARMKELKSKEGKPADADKPALEAALSRMQECAMKMELGG